MQIRFVVKVMLIPNVFRSSLKIVFDCYIKIQNNVESKGYKQHKTKTFFKIY